jgi:CubicO group peptidase (beta-lactamase class C family)
MILVEEGKVSLADPVAQYLPELKDVKVGIEKKDDSGGMQLVLETPQRAMTIHDLLRHTSGFTYGFFGKSLVKDQYNAAKVTDAGQTSAEFITKLASIPLQYHPGTTWECSVSTDVLGRIIEVVSGAPLDQFVAERVLAPLKMTDTGFWVEQREKHGRIAEPQVDPATGKRPTVPDRTQKPNWLSGGGGMVSTRPTTLVSASSCSTEASSMVRACCRARRSSTWLLTTYPLGIRVNGFSVAVIDARPENGQGFGLGFTVRTSAGRTSVPGSVGDFGWTGIYGTQFWVDPKEQMYAVMMLQTATPATRAKYWMLMRDLVYQAIVD